MVDSALAATRAVFDYTRRVQRLVEWRGRGYTLPETAAGWLLPRAGEPREGNGLRPFGALWEELQLLVASSDLRDEDKQLLNQWYGLYQHPRDLTGDAQSLDQRFGNSRRHRSSYAPVAARSLQIRREAALRQLTKVMEPRQAPARQYGPLPPSWRQPWVQTLVSTQVDVAVAKAKEILAVGDSHEATGLANRLHSDLDMLLSLATQGETTFPARLRPANAALSVGLWFAARANSATSGLLPAPHETRRHSGQARDVVTAIYGRSAVSGKVLAIAPSAAAPLLRGYRDEDALIAACDAALGSALSQEIAWPLLEICVSEAQRNVLGRSEEVRVQVLAAVAHFARSSEDWRVIALARQLVDEFPRHHLTLRALTDVSVVAGAHRQFPLAVKALSLIDELLADIAWPRGRDRTVEIAEWRYQNQLSLTGVLRRRTEAELQRGQVRSLRETESRIVRCLKDVGQIPGFDGVRSSVGDANVGYVTRAMLRQAEVHTLAAHASAASNPSDREASSRSLFSARNLITEASDLSRAHGGGNFEPHILRAKLLLSAAIIEGDPDRSAQAARHLVGIGWPLERSNLPIFLALAEASTGQLTPSLTPGMRLAARVAIESVNELADEERTPYLVPAGNRRRQLTSTR